MSFHISESKHSIKNTQKQKVEEISPWGEDEPTGLEFLEMSDTKQEAKSSKRREHEFLHPPTTERTSVTASRLERVGSRQDHKRVRPSSNTYSIPIRSVSSIQSENSKTIIPNKDLLTGFLQYCREGGDKQVCVDASKRQHISPYASFREIQSSHKMGNVQADKWEHLKDLASESNSIIMQQYASNSSIGDLNSSASASTMVARREAIAAIIKKQYSRTINVEGCKDVAQQLSDNLATRLTDRKKPVAIIAGGNNVESIDNSQLLSINSAKNATVSTFLAKNNQQQFQHLNILEKLRNQLNGETDIELLKMNSIQQDYYSSSFSSIQIDDLKQQQPNSRSKHSNEIFQQYESIPIKYSAGESKDAKNQTATTTSEQEQFFQLKHSSQLIQQARDKMKYSTPMEMQAMILDILQSDRSSTLFAPSKRIRSTTVNVRPITSLDSSEGISEQKGYDVSKNSQKIPNYYMQNAQKWRRENLVASWLSGDNNVQKTNSQVNALADVSNQFQESSQTLRDDMKFKESQTTFYQQQQQPTNRKAVCVKQISIFAKKQTKELDESQTRWHQRASQKEISKNWKWQQQVKRSSKNDKENEYTPAETISSQSGLQNNKQKSFIIQRHRQLIPQATAAAATSTNGFIHNVTQN